MIEVGKWKFISVGRPAHFVENDQTACGLAYSDAAGYEAPEGMERCSKCIEATEKAGKPGRRAKK